MGIYSKELISLFGAMGNKGFYDKLLQMNRKANGKQTQN